MRRDYKDQSLGTVVLDLADQIDSREVSWHLEVGDHQLVVRFTKEFQRLIAVGCRGDLVRFARKAFGESRSDIWLVVNNQDAKRLFGHSCSLAASIGKSMRNVVPSALVS